MSKVIVRSNTKKELSGVSDSTRYQMLLDYSTGLSMKDIAVKHDTPRKATELFLSSIINSMASIKETRALAKPLIATQLKTPISTMNQQWLEKVEQNAEMYAYYYATTGSNMYALEESKLDEDLPSGTSGRAKKYIMGARGRYLQSIPAIYKKINEIRDQRVKDSDIGKSLIQSELMTQIDELKALSDENPKYRTHLLKAIELLGKTEAAFTETINVSDTSAKTGMDILMAKVKERQAVSGDTEETYAIETGTV